MIYFKKKVSNYYSDIINIVLQLYENNNKFQNNNTQRQYKKEKLSSISPDIIYYNKKNNNNSLLIRKDILSMEKKISDSDSISKSKRKNKVENFKNNIISLNKSQDQLHDFNLGKNDDLL